MTGCPNAHSYADDQACRYGGAYNHGIIRCLWMQQLREWGLYPYFLERRQRAGRED